MTGQTRPLSACYIWINLIVHLTSVCITPSPSPRRVATLLKLLGWSWQSDRTARPCHWMSARCCTEKHAAYLDLLKWSKILRLVANTAMKYCHWFHICLEGHYIWKSSSNHLGWIEMSRLLLKANGSNNVSKDLRFSDCGKVIFVSVRPPQPRKWCEGGQCPYLVTGPSFIFHISALSQHSARCGDRG